MEFLSMEDRSFLTETEEFLERRSELHQELITAKSDFETLVAEYESNQKLLDVVYEDLSRLHSLSVVKAVVDHEEMVRQKFGRCSVSSEFPISNDAADILHYNSDSE